MICHSLIACVVSAHAAASDGEASDLVAKLKNSLERIDTIEASFTMSLEKVPSRAGNQLDEDGHLIWETFSWRHDRELLWSYFEGKVGSHLEGKTQYRDVVYAWNGMDWVSYADDRKGALMGSDPWPVLSSQRTVATLLGDGLFGSQTNDVTDILENGGDLKAKALPSGLQRLTCDFNTDLKKSGTYWYQLIVDLDPKHDYLPRKMVVIDKVCGLPVAVVEIGEYAKTSNGIWLPIRGTDTRYQNKYVESKSIESSLKSAKTAEERFEIARNFVVDYTRKLGAGTMFLAIDPSTLEVNKVFSQSDFSFNLPENAGYLDTRTGESRPLPKPKRPELGSGGISTAQWILVVTSTIAAAIVALFAWRSSRGEST